MAKAHEDKQQDTVEVNDVSYLLNDAADLTDDKDNKLVATVEVRSREQETVSLGEFDDQHPPKGFVVEYASEIDPSSVACRIIELRGVSSGMVVYKLFLGNFDDKAITAEIREL